MEDPIVMSWMQPIESVEHIPPQPTLHTPQPYKQTSPKRSRSPKRPLNTMEIPPSPNALDRHASHSSTAPSSTLSSVSATPPPQLDGAADSGPPPAKRRKLTPTERAIRDREKAETKVKREEEKRVRDEGRRQKNEATEERKRDTELKKQEKEQEKQMKKQKIEDEKAKKERAQPRINGFFTKPQSFVAEVPTSVVAPPDIASSVPNPGSLPLSRAGTPGDLTALEFSTKVASDYAKNFLPFEAASNSTVAPQNHFSWDREATELALKRADAWLHPHDNAIAGPPLRECLDLDPLEMAPRALSLRNTRDMLLPDHGSSDSPVDLTNDETHVTSRQSTGRRGLIIKYIFFHQDVRPPYVGTISKGHTRDELARLGRNPFRAAQEELEYDYDSEAEWEEPGEGEDLKSEADDDAESDQDPAELEEFLDDQDVDEASKLKRKMLYSDMQPLSSGLCWENDDGNTTQSISDPMIDPRQFCLEILCDDIRGPIDPFSTSYWPNVANVSSIETATTSTSTLFRPPLHTRPNTSMNSLSPASAALASKPAKPPKQTRILTGLELESFKRIVTGSDLTKVGLLAIAKKQMPKVSNAVLSDTLGTVAARVGAKEVDKRWKLL